MFHVVAKISEIQGPSLFTLQCRMRYSGVGFENERERLVINVKQNLKPYDVWTKTLEAEHDAQRLFFDL